jgi:hypothetical protein
MKCRNLFYTFLLLLGTHCHCWGSETDSLWKIYHLRTTAPEQVNLLVAISASLNGENKLSERDSIVALAIELASTDDTLRAKVTREFFNETITDVSLAKELASSFLEVAQHSRNDEWLYSAYAAKAKAAMANNDFGEANAEIERAFRAVSLTDNEELKAECYMLWGECFQARNSKLDAFSSYLQAMFIAEKLEKPELLNPAYGKLSGFYFSISNWKKARDYKLFQINAAIHQMPVDSIRYYNLLADLARILLRNEQAIEGTKALNRIIRFASRRGLQDLQNAAFNVLGSYLFDKTDFPALVDVFTRKYPHQLAYFARNDLLYYYRLQASFAEYRGDFHTANDYFLKAKYQLSQKDEGPAFSSKFHIRYGQFLNRQGHSAEAILAFDTAYLFARQARFLPFLEESTHYLDSLSLKMGAIDKAYYYAKLNRSYADSLAQARKADDLLLSEVEFQQKQEELILEKKEAKIRRRHNIQYMGLTMGITTSFIILAMLGSFKVHRSVIKGMGFFSFIFFFEFIILLADNQIHHYTHGEPWKIMAIKIVLIGILLPLHHYVEERVVHYLSHHKLIDTSKLSFSWFKKKPAELPKSAPKEELISEN